jgi:hypothetical protein
MASTASGNTSAHSIPTAGPVSASGNPTGGGGLEELLPLVTALTNAEQVRKDVC